MTRDYFGTKRVTAWSEERDGKPGYAVKYADGYVSWSPVDTFEAAYQPLDALSFGHMLVALQTGARAARKGWNGKDMFVFYVAGSKFEVSRAPLSDHFPMGTPIEYRPHIDMRSADGQIGVWLASQSDILANDWVLLGEH